MKIIVLYGPRLESKEEILRGFYKKIKTLTANATNIVIILRDIKINVKRNIANLSKYELR